MDNRRGKGRAGFRPALMLLEDRLVPAGRPLPFPVIAAGTDAGVPAQARLIDADTGFLLLNENPYGPSYTGGIRVALGDLTRDGYPDLVIAPVSSAASILRVLDGRSGAPVVNLDGILVSGNVTALAVGDLTEDHFPDIAVSLDDNSGIRVQVFSGRNGTPIREYRSTASSMPPITSLAIGNLTGNLSPDLVLGSLAGVQIVDGQTWTLSSGPWDAFPGSAVGVGDLTGDGLADLVTIAVESGSIRVRALDVVTGWVVLDASPMLLASGIPTVGLAYVNDDNRADIVVGAGTGITVLNGATGNLLPDTRRFHVPFGDGIPLLSVAAANDPYPPYLPALMCPDTAMVGSDVPMSLLVFGGVPDGPEWVTGSVAFTATAGSMEYALGTGSIIPGLESPGEAYAAITTNILPPGVYTVTATYSGDDYFLSDSLSGTITIIDSAIAGLQNQPPVDEVCCACAGPAGLGGGANVPAPSPRSSSGVAYGSGVIRVDQTGPSIQGGTRLGANWSWSNASGYLDGLSGRNATMGGMPHLTESSDGSTVAMVSSATSARFFDLVDGSYFPRFFDTATLEHDTTAHQLVMQDGAGTTFTWYDFSSSVPSGRSGKLVSMSDSFGNQTQVTGWTAAGNPTGYEQTDGSASRRMSYGYVSAGVNAGNIASISLDEQEGAGPWETVRTVEYAYYGASAPSGSPDELKSVVVKDASGAVVDGSYYRYYTEGNASGLMKFAFGSAAYSRLTGALGTGVDALTDAQVDDYADMALTYDIMGRVSLVVEARAGCSACSGGLGTYTYSYGTSGNAEGYNSWDTRTVETLPDGGHIIVYTNAFGQIMLREETDGVTGQARVTYFRYDGAGRLVMSAQPSAVSGYNDIYPDLVDFSDGNAAFLRDDAGLLAMYAYGSETTASGSAPGSVEGRLDTVVLRHGEAGANVPQTTISYVSHTDSAGSVVYAVAQTVSYRSDDGSGAVVSGQSYAYFSGTNQVETVAATNPAVPSTQNGSGISSIITTVQDSHGRPVWTRDAAGVIGYNAYDPVSGGVVRTIADVDTSLDADFAGLPSGWSTPAGAGRHLIADFEVDGLGRQTRAAWPDGRIDYTVYNDAAHEVRYYIAWHDGSPTVPIRVEREDRQGGYVESFSMTATPAVSEGRPTGAEAIGNLTALSRTVLNAAGQAVARREYVNLESLSYTAELTLGTSGTNYLETVQAYDKLGRLAKTVTPAGTIHRTVFDSAGRPVSEWVGTNDTPDSGYWSPWNPAGMAKVAENLYDGGGTGDGWATRRTVYGGVPGTPDQVTDNAYDWRGRLVGTKVGVEATEDAETNRPITVFDYDNANRVIRQRVYDGDAVSLTDAAGQLSLPDASLLRAQSRSHYDDLGRIYLAQTDSVDPGDGTVGGTLSTRTWFDARGLLVKQESPGAPVRKMAYDSMGWLSAEYATDGGGDSSQADALTVTGDTVLEQTETTHDNAGRVIGVVHRQRFHDATASGELGDPSSTTLAKARVSYAANYYDTAGRLVAAAQAGTNGGVAWTRPISLPESSDTLLVTAYAYDPAGMLRDVTDARGMVTRTLRDALGRATTTIQDHGTGRLNITTRYSYGPAGLTRLTAENPAGVDQVTEWAYGVTVSGGSGIDSNDIVGEVRHADPATGVASAAAAEMRQLSAQGQVVAMTDRNGTVHGYSYDAVGRMTADAVTTLGTGVDGTIRRQEYRYDALGRGTLFTAYDAVEGGAVVNEVRRAYNGLGQLVREWQSHAGAVNPVTTPSVQYAYAEALGGNHSRPESMTYPGGDEVVFGYGSGVDDAISRLTTVADGANTVEVLSYLGLGTVVMRTHAETGVTLGYLKQSGEADGDAGDRYTGLDRFGRVVDQRWVSGSNTDVERYQYGYDRAGNRLFKDNTVISDLSEQYAYDALGQLTDYQQGTPGDAVTRTQSWDLDPLGNWSTVTTDGVDQIRTHNAQNELTGIGEAASLTYDGNGNLTTDENEFQFRWDAWNRLVQVRDASDTVVATYGRDALGRRITVEQGETVTDRYFSSEWQLLEEKVGEDTVTRNVWSPVYVDALVLRDRDTDGNGTLDERLYPLQDANWNVMALVTPAGTVVERYSYDPYGQVTVRDGSGAVIAGSAKDWVFLHQGGEQIAAGDYDFRNRAYSPTLGRWLSNDPIGFEASDNNWYRYEGSSPGNRVDPSGLLFEGPWRGYPYAPTDPPAHRMTGLPNYLRNLAASEECKAEAERIGKAIMHTYLNNWSVFALAFWTERKKGYFCYDWSYAFEDAFNIESSSKCFKVKVHEVMKDDLGGNVHFYISIISIENPKNVAYVDDGFGNGDKYYTSDPPHPDKYNIPGLASDQPRENCNVPPAYDCNGRRKSK